MTKKHYIDTGAYRIQHASYSGCSAPLSDPMDLAEAQAKLVLKRVRAASQGYPVSVSDDGNTLEIESPADAFMVGDVEGVYQIVPDQEEAFECFECGSLVRKGEACDCLEYEETDEVENDR